MTTANITHTNNTGRLLQLIEAVKKRPCLWDLDADGYGTKVSKDHLWEAIGKESGYCGLEAKATWKKLRDIHRDSVKRRKDRLLQPWKFSRQMEFLLPHMKKRALRSGDEVYRVFDAEDKKRRKVGASSAASETDSEAMDEVEPLKCFFDTMHATTKKLPELLQLEIKRKIFEVVSNSEEKYLRNLDEDPVIDKGEMRINECQIKIEPDLDGNSDDNDDYII